MKDLWNKEKEIEFFTQSRKFATPEQLFYVSDDKRYFAYWPKNYKEPGLFTYGISNNISDGKISLCVELHGYCRTIQEFPYQSFKDHNFSVDDMVPILKKAFKIRWK